MIDELSNAIYNCVNAQKEKRQSAVEEAQKMCEVLREEIAEVQKKAELVDQKRKDVVLLSMAVKAFSREIDDDMERVGNLLPEDEQTEEDILMEEESLYDEIEEKQNKRDEMLDILDRMLDEIDRIIDEISAQNKSITERMENVTKNLSVTKKVEYD